MKAPFGHVFITGSNLHVRRNDRIKTDFFHAVGGEIYSGAVLRLICETGGVEKESCLGSIIPFRA